jgi:hypothetical protein
LIGPSIDSDRSVLRVICSDYINCLSWLMMPIKQMLLGQDTLSPAWHLVASALRRGSACES